MKNILFALFSLLSINAIGQNGTFRGTVIDDKTGEAVMFANIFIEELASGTTTDLDGTFSYDLPNGTYKVTFSYIGFADLAVTEVEISAGKVTLLDVRMKEDAQVLDEVVVTAKQLRNTEAALATIKQRSTNLLDGVSSQSIKRTGDSNAGEALRRVTGVSVEGGKHVVVRGLGDRYTKTILNSVEIPGLDPDRNSVQMDLFPSNLIDNLIVYKTFSPDLPGDFSGGAVNIVTKDFPEKFTFSATAGFGYNPSMHFRNDFLDYQGSKTDWLGYDDGSRKLPFSKNFKIPDPTKNLPILNSATQAFNSQLASQPSNNNLNKSLGLSIGNQYNFGRQTIGVFGALNYSENFEHYQNASFKEFYRNVNDNGYTETRASQGVLSQTFNQWSAMGGISYKYKNHKISFQALHVQSGEKKAGKFLQTESVFNNAKLLKDNIEYYERAITNLNLSGNHVFANGKFDIDWKLSPSFVTLNEPDIRTTGFDIFDGAPVLRPSVGAEVTRAYRNLDEVDYNGRADFAYNFNVNGRQSKLKLGTYVSMKQRDYQILNYIFQARNQSELDINGDANKILAPENVWSPENQSGIYVFGNFEPSNTFNAKQNVLAAYLMNEMPLTSKLKLTYGVRAEKSDNFYTGQNNQGTVKLVNQKILDNFNILPSANILYALANKTNLRISGNQTVARPSFKENSVAQIQDRITGRTFLGNIDLKQSRISNADIRLEHFMENGQLISGSVFFKRFIDPIQLVVYDVSVPTDYQPKNLANTNVYGFEVELNKNLSTLSSRLTDVSVGLNYTYVNAQIPLVGLSPSIFNASLSYNNRENGWEGSLAYNVQARRLSIVGVGRIEDVYENSFPSLNTRISKKFGSNQQYGVSFGVENILDSRKWRAYNTQDSSEAVYDSFNPGRQFNLSLSYKI